MIQLTDRMRAQLRICAGPYPEGAAASAVVQLQDLGLVDSGRKLTERGRRALRADARPATKGRTDRHG